MVVFDFYVRLYSQHLYRKYIDDLFSGECRIVGDRGWSLYFLYIFSFAFRFLFTLYLAFKGINSGNKYKKTYENINFFCFCFRRWCYDSFSSGLYFIFRRAIYWTVSGLNFAKKNRNWCFCSRSRSRTFMLSRESRKKTSKRFERNWGLCGSCLHQAIKEHLLTLTLKHEYNSVAIHHVLDNKAQKNYITHFEKYIKWEEKKTRKVVRIDWKLRKLDFHDFSLLASNICNREKKNYNVLSYFKVYIFFCKAAVNSFVSSFTLTLVSANFRTLNFCDAFHKRGRKVFACFDTLRCMMVPV